MERVESVSVRVSKQSWGTAVPRKLPKEQKFPREFGAVAKALWPNKTAAHVAALAGVTERAAKHWISDRREPSPEIIAVVVDRMLGRRPR